MARRQASRGEQRRLPRVPLRLLLVLFSIAGLVGTAGWIAQRLGDPELHPVRVVRLKGAIQNLDPAELRERVLPHVQTGFLAVDVELVRLELESMPWVRQAAVRRSWPDVLEVRVVEQIPVARWRDEALVNDAGELFSPERGQWPDGLPRIEGPDGSAVELMARFSEFRALLQPAALDLAAVEMTERRAWRMTLGNGIELVAGRDAVLQRLERFVSVWPTALAPRSRQIGRVDLRYTNGFAVDWRKPDTAGA